MPTHFIFIGNPGSGKATLLNILCNGDHFDGGPSVGTGLTGEFIAKKYGDITYMDTPGLNDVDDEKRAAACQALAALLKGGGGFKVIFVLGSSCGCLLSYDVQDMRMVLDLVPAITMNNFGIIINKVDERTMQFLETAPDSGAPLQLPVSYTHLTLPTKRIV